jgi:inositol oxygenase
MSASTAPAEIARPAGPMTDVDDWQEVPRARYAPADEPEEGRSFRDYRAEARPSVKEFYRLNHMYQTRDFARAKKAEYSRLDRRQMGIWEAAEFLNTLVDDSDPDTDLSQLEHLLQTAEDTRANGEPRWFILAAFIHDLGKILCLWDEPQWAVVGDTFPVGCAYSERVVFPEYFAANPDAAVPEYQPKCGVYEEGCGLDAVDLSWGHDEYIYQVTREYLPVEAQYMLRYHSFYSAHSEGAYRYLMNDRDQELFAWVRRFQPYDLYSKGHEKPDVAALAPFYRDLIAEYFPPTLRW